METDDGEDVYLLHSIGFHWKVQPEWNEFGAVRKWPGDGNDWAHPDNVRGWLSQLLHEIFGQQYRDQLGRPSLIPKTFEPRIIRSIRGNAYGASIWLKADEADLDWFDYDYDDDDEKDHDDLALPEEYEMLARAVMDAKRIVSEAISANLSGTLPDEPWY
ncbi:hypothetical protein AB0O58_13090 [Rhodococcus sp. NPDC080181]|uniref:hypothetical protein n=1 Tax=Rhodococcus sp. NPDC080181 TaxID=3155292 RepID=UPI00344F6F3C